MIAAAAVAIAYYCYAPPSFEIVAAAELATSYYCCSDLPFPLEVVAAAAAVDCVASDEDLPNCTHRVVQVAALVVWWAGI